MDLSADHIGRKHLANPAEHQFSQAEKSTNSLNHLRPANHFRPYIGKKTKIHEKEKRISQTGHTSDNISLHFCYQPAARLSQAIINTNSYTYMLNHMAKQRSVPHYEAKKIFVFFFS